MILQAAQSASESLPRFTEEPVPVFEYFQANVRRLLHDNLDIIRSLALDSHEKQESVEFISLIDPEPLRGEPIQYHDIWESFVPRHPQSRRPDTTFSVHLSKVAWEAPERSLRELRPARKHSYRTYTASESDGGIVIVEHRDTSFGHPRVRKILEGTVEDPRAIGDPLDSPGIALLKQDFERLKRSTPVPVPNRPHRQQ
jgi:hypothetical protein